MRQGSKADLVLEGEICNERSLRDIPRKVWRHASRLCLAHPTGSASGQAIFGEGQSATVLLKRGEYSTEVYHCQTKSVMATRDKRIESETVALFWGGILWAQFTAMLSEVGTHTPDHATH